VEGPGKWSASGPALALGGPHKITRQRDKTRIFTKEEDIRHGVPNIYNIISYFVL